MQKIDVNPWWIIDRAPPGVSGGTLHISEADSGPKTFNPIVASESSSLNITGKIFSTLLDYNFKSNKVVKGLVYRWDNAADKKTWTFHLRKGLRWSDGIPITADDILFTFRAIYDPKVDNPNRDFLWIRGKPIQCKKVDDLTVIFFLPEAYAPFLYLMSTIPIVPAHKLAKALPEGVFSSSYNVNVPPNDIVGSNAFRLKEYRPGQQLTLERNPYFYAKDTKGERLPYLDRIIIQYVPDNNTQYLKFMAGEVDAFTEFPNLFYEDVKAGEKNGNYRLIDLGQMAGISFLMFNENPNPRFLNRTQYHWFSNRRFRLATAYGINREKMIRLACLGHGYPLTQDFHPQSRFYNPKLKPSPYDPEKARALLKEAGFSWKNRKLFDDLGNPVIFSLITNTGNILRRSLAELIKADLEQLGMQVDFHLIDLNQMATQLDSTFTWQAIVAGFGDGGTSIEPANSQGLWLSSGYFHYWYPRQKTPSAKWETEMDRLAWEGLIATDIEKRKKIYARIEEILYHEQVPVILTIMPSQFDAFRNTIGNANPTPLGGFWMLSADDMLMDQVYIKHR